MPEPKFIFSMSGRPGDSPEVGPTVVFEQQVLPKNHGVLIAVCEKIAELWADRAAYGCLNAVDVAAVRMQFLGKILGSVASYDSEHAESQIVFKDETTDESCWVTSVRVYFVDPEEVE